MTRRRDYTGINIASKTRRLSSGDLQRVVYFYRRACGTSLGNSNEGMTREQAVEVVRLWEQEATQSGPTAGTVRHLFILYRKSAHFKNLAIKTRREYELEMSRLDSLLGSLMVNSLKKRDIIDLRDARVATPYGSNATLRTFSAILTWGMDEVDFVEQNVARDVSQLPTQPRNAVWMEEHREAFMEVAPPHLRRVLATLHYTVQRTRDALLLRKDAVYEHRGRLWINLRQTKTGSLVAIPLHANLLKVFEANPVAGDYLCPSPTGGHWSYDSVAHAWDRAVRLTNIRIARRILEARPLPPWQKRQKRQVAKSELRKHLIIGLQRRDLRRTGMIELALCGVPDTQIAALSGHAIEATRRILETYIPRRGELALAAMETWETSAGKVIALNTLPVQRPLELAIERGMNKSANPTANRRASANGLKA